ncbi:MAG: AAA family ATPase [Chloroflexota bacterium]|nr:AAA family ATPase [Chloroflexota bacterium]
MYIKSFRVKNLKCFADLEIDFSKRTEDNPDSQSNWNVILGDNGYGKSALLQALAVCLMNTTIADRMAKPNTWIRRAKGPTVEFAELNLVLVQEEKVSGEKKFDVSQGPKSSAGNMERTVVYRIVQVNPSTARVALAEEPSTKDIEILSKTAFAGKPRKGWISCGYGPFRRVYGFSNETATIQDPLQKRFITLFNEGASLHECERWLKELERKAIKSKQGSRQRQDLGEAQQVICGLLPGVGKISIGKSVADSNEDRVIFWYGNDSEDATHREEFFSLDNLSDGYRSMFALIIDMLSWFLTLRTDSSIPLHEVPGVVLIDEIDAHLHPLWQTQAGYLLTRTFPNVQFIVATHSPYVAMAAGQHALFKLGRDGNSIVAHPQEYVRGWPVDQVLKEIFGVGIRDQDTEEKLRRYDELSGFAQQRPLNQQERDEYERLEEELKLRLSEAEDFREQQLIYQDTAALIEMARARKQGWQ